MAESGENSGDASPGRTVWWIPSVFAVVVAVVLVVTTFFYPIRADDIWWHLETGEFIMERMHLPEQNLYSYTAPEHHWLPHEWLSEVLFYLDYRWLGFRGLVALGVLLNALACALVYRLTLRYSGSPYASALITLLASLMMLGNFSLRPYLFGNLFFICTLHAMEEPAAGGRLRPALVFLLFATWANFHGSFLIGLALILLYAAAVSSARLFQRGGGSGLASAVSSGRSYALDFLVALVACMVTPNHVFGLIFPLQYLQRAFSQQMSYLTNISEWQPAGFQTPLGQMITFYLMFCGFAVMGSRKSPRPVHLGLLVAFSVFAFSSIRNIPLLGIAATPVLARHLPVTLGRIFRVLLRQEKLQAALERFHRATVQADARGRSYPLLLLLGAALLAIFLLPARWPLSYPALSRIQHLSDLSPDFYPRGLLEELDRLPTGKRVFNYFNWGGAIIWRLYPRQRVFIDQRNDCYPLGVFRDYFAVHNLERDWREVLERWQIDYVAYPPGSRLAQELANSPAWRLVWSDARAALFARTHLPLAPSSFPSPTAPPPGISSISRNH